MGGLAGLIQFRGDPPEPELLARMAQRQQSRGPDGSGAWADGPAAFHNRLRRIRPGKKVQPVVAHDLVVMLDGWIYDHLDLVRDLPGFAPDLSDTEALLLAWRRYGIDVLGRIDGEFAFSVWDRRARTLALARDRMGVRPMHYAARGDKFAFASEIAPLLEVPWVSREPEPQRLAEYLSFGVVHAPRTLLQEVHQVEPGSTVRVDADGVRARTWWRIRYAPVGSRRPRDSEVIERLEELVDRAVSKRMPKDVPTGLYLSGGLGSSSIAASARRKGLSLPSFTVSLADDPFPEAPFAGRVARLLGLEHHEVLVSSADVAQQFDASVRVLGQPVGQPGTVLQLMLARVAREHVRVALSGDGGEELFGSERLDDLVRMLRIARWVGLLPRPARFALQGVVGRERVARYSVPPERFALEHGLGGVSLFSAAERGAILRDPALARPAVRTDVLGAMYAELDTDPINTVLHGWLRSALSEAVLTRTDRTAAATGLDVRFPLLDREVVEATAALPGAVKVRRVAGSVHSRWPLRALLRGELPEVLVDRPKRGLPTLLGSWLAGPGRLFLEERCARLKRDQHGLWNGAAIEELRRAAGRSHAAGNKLWALFVLDEWMTALKAG
jgi:asparagine synthase (glutamine-hydrolysing)